jgi:hypothetical protein
LLLFAFAGGAFAAEPVTGEHLARKYCSTCHVFPEPALLTKIQWTHHIMPNMAVWLGIEPPNYEEIRDAKILQQAQIFPTAPMLSQKEWFAIWDYYKANSPEEPTPPPQTPTPKADLKLFRARKINFHSGAPMTSLVKIGSKRIYVGDAVANSLATIDATGNVLDRVRANSPPIALQIMTNGLLVTLIGRIFPSDVTEGAAVMVRANQTLERAPLLAGLRRPTDVRASDLNGDGKEDLAVCEFGNRLGRFSVQFNLGSDEYSEQVLFERPGAIRSEIVDLNGDGLRDIVVLTAQAREGLYIYYNEGKGKFRVETVLEQPPTFGFADFQVVDFNKDGKLDFILVNGDNGDFATPHKAYHGIRLYLNQDANTWKESWFYPLEGAYKALPADYDGDGDLDIAAISFYPDFSKGKDALSFVYLENLGNLKFAAHTIPESSAGRWMVMDAKDLDGDGDTDIVLGSFVRGPTTIPVPPELEANWRTNGAAVLLLENTTR